MNSDSMCVDTSREAVSTHLKKHTIVFVFLSLPFECILQEGFGLSSSPGLH